ncbi:tyrosine-type recombinase/integrase [Streptomyces yaanensis]|uniref:Tyrosine-type recombinase/integrase n=1 Tax=Streptomyces yaanensis TaxID=1142239 RepID=A0ABV7SDS3_9ACTN|nr:site-specific integrase [Streptomyces sp. CGMCC 4.7035]WNB99267.1 site-specific integrase [Streptomyces sp. CGMCC 4.7035]
MKALSAHSVQAYTTPLKAVFTAAVNNGDVGRHPFVGAKLPLLPSRAVDETLLPSGQQVQDIADEFRQEWALSVWLMAGLGLRKGEMLGLRVGDFLDDRVRIRRQVTRVEGVEGAVLGPLKHRREGDWRDIPLATNLSDAAREHVDRYGTGPDGALFQTISGTLVSTPGYSRTFRNAMKTLGYNWSPRDLRHWFASTALSNGLPLLDVSRWLGRKSIKETADTYGHLTPDSTGRAVRVMGLALTQHRADSVLTEVA